MYLIHHIRTVVANFSYAENSKYKTDMLQYILFVPNSDKMDTGVSTASKDFWVMQNYQGLSTSPQVPLFLFNANGKRITAPHPFPLKYLPSTVLR